MNKSFDVIVDDDNVDIIDWIQSHFHNGSWDKIFKVSVTLSEVCYNEEGELIYVEKEKQPKDKLEERTNMFMEKYGMRWRSASDFAREMEFIETFGYKQKDLDRLIDMLMNIAYNKGREDGW